MRAPDLCGMQRKEGRLISLGPDHWRESLFLTFMSLHMDGHGLPQKRRCQENVSGPFCKASQFSSEQRSSHFKFFAAYTQGLFKKYFQPLL